MRWLSAFLFAAMSWGASPHPATSSLVASIQASLAESRVADAKRELASALALHPDDPALLNLYGVVEAQAGDLKAAERCFLKALAQAPRSSSIYENLGRLYRQSLATDADALIKSINVYRKLTAFDPGNRNAQYQLALMLGYSGKCPEALGRLISLPEQARQRPQAIALSSACNVASNRGQVALELKRLQEVSHTSAQDILDVIPVLQTASDYGRIAELVDSISKDHETDRAILGSIASLQEKFGQYAAARNTLDKIAQIAEVSPGLLISLARNAYQAKDYEGTLGYLAHARDLQPENPSIHFFFGMTAVSMELPLEAKKSLAEAVRLDPENANYQYAYGAVLAQDRDASLAIPHLKKYCDLKPDDVRGRFALAVAYYLSSDFDQARDEFNMLATRKATSAGARYFLGRIAKQQNRLTDAERELQQALKLDPNHLDARAELGQVHTRLRKYDLAEHDLQTVLEKEPVHYYANLNLLELYQRTKDGRAQKQAEQLETIKSKRSEKEQALWRTIEVRPY